jgi:hypothetical protein
MSSGKKILKAFLLWEKILSFSEQKEEKKTLDYVQNPIRQYKLASIPIVQERPVGTFHNRNFLPWRIAEGKMKGMLTNGNSGEAHRIGPVPAGDRQYGIISGRYSAWNYDM